MWLMILKSFYGIVFFQQLEDLLLLKFYTESAGANHLGLAFGFSTMAYALECSRNHERYHIPSIINSHYNSNRNICMGSKIV